MIFVHPVIRVSKGPHFRVQLHAMSSALTSSLPMSLRSSLRFLLGLIVCLLLPAAIYAWHWSMSEDAFGATESGKITLLKTAIFGLGPDTEGVPEGAALITLPHRVINLSMGDAHYRLPFEISPGFQHESPMALCVPKWSANPSIWIDGQRLLNSASGRLDVKGLFRPAFVPLPLNLMPGEHRIDIRLHTVAGMFPGLSEVWLGEHHVVAAQCGALQDIVVGSRTGGLFLMLFITLVSACVFASQREALSLGLTLTGLAWCLHSLVVLNWLGNLSDQAWMTWFMVTRPLAGFAGLFVAMHLVKIRQYKLDWALLGLAALIYAALFVLPSSQWHLWLMGVAFVMVPLTLCLGLYVLWFSTVKSRFLSDFAFAMCMIYGVSANAMDLARAKGWLPYSGLSMQNWIAPLLALAIGLLAIERLVSYLRYKQVAASQLKQELAKQKIQLAAYHEEVRVQREKNLLTQERQRLVRDMHDGLGTQLVSASALLKSGVMHAEKSQALSHLIDQALLDLRSMLDVFASPQWASDEEDQEAVSLLLAMLRHRLAPVFRSQGIEVEWQSGSLPHDFLKSDQDRLQLLRCLQEACTNIIKHAKATQVVLKTHVTSTQIVFEVRDDGCGMEACNAGKSGPKGHGLSNMAARAHQMGAQLVMDSSTSGTCVRLVFNRSTPTTRT
jgi:signal transduction histidine kinase